MQFDKNHDQSFISDKDEVFALTTTHECVMHGSVLRQHQEKDVMLQKIKNACLARNNNPDYQLLPLLGCTLVDYKKRVVVPDTLREDLIAWYHYNLGHPASDRQYKTMQPIFYWPSMSATIERFIHACVVCKQAKLHGGKQQHGLLPPRTLRSANPFDVVHVDLIGPYAHAKYGIAIIDHTTRWLEVGV